LRIKVTTVRQEWYVSATNSKHHRAGMASSSSNKLKRAHTASQKGYSLASLFGRRLPSLLDSELVVGYRFFTVPHKN
jgi:hypothetical protein